MRIRDSLLKLIPPSLRQSAVDLKNELYGGYRKYYYSQFGEDIIVASLLGSPTGLYVDVGANHPKRYSNTALLYERGWCGINIEPNEEAITLFKRVRPRDINIRSGVGMTSNTLMYYRFSDPAVNTFSFEMAQELRKKRWLTELSSEKVSIRSLRDILLENLSENTSVDFFNVDVEGFDLEVLQSNDWFRFRPRVIAVEDHQFNPTNMPVSPIYAFLTEKQYRFVIRMGPTCIFKDSRSN